MLQFWLKWGGDEMKRCWKMSEGSKLVLASWKGSVTWSNGMAMSAGGEVASGMEKGRDDTSWANGNLTGPKNEENSCG
jgi:hypothetical protein